MRRVLGLLLVLGGVALLGGGLSRTSGVRAAQVGSVSGQVRNGSPGGQALSGVEVDLHAFDGTNDQVIATTTSDAAGTYQFENVEINASAQYSVSVTFAKVPYFSQPFKFDASGHQAADLTVYNTTTSDAAIGVDRLSIVVANVDSKQRLLTLVESYHFNNSGQETYVGQLVGSSVQSLRFPLFNGAQSLTPEGGFELSDAASIPTGFALSLPVLPGASTIVFAYQIPYRGHALALNRVVSYKTAVTEVILPAGVNLSSPQLTGQGTVSVGGQSLATIQGTGLQPGAPLELEISGLPLSSDALLPLDSLRTQILLVVIVVAAAVLSVVAYRGHSGRQRTADQRAERQRLLRRIAQLDDRFEAGKLDKDAYAREREAVKTRLRDLTSATPVATRTAQTSADPAGYPSPTPQSRGG